MEVEGPLKQGPDSLTTPDDCRGEADGRQEVSGEPVISGKDAPEVFQATKRVLDTVPFAVRFLAEAERLFSIRPVRNDRPVTALLQPFSQLRAIVRLVAEQLLRRFPTLDEWFRRRTVMRRAISQHQGEKTAFSTSDCVDLRVASTSRAPDRLILLPPFPPDAERWDFTWVESIICVSVQRPHDASSLNNRSHTPRFAQRTKRL